MTGRAGRTAPMHVLGVFDRGRMAADAVRAVRAHDLGRVTVYGPAPHHDIDHALAPRTSPVRVFTLLGAVVGCVSGFALQVYTVDAWPLITGGKPLMSLPAFAIVALELAILFGAIAGMVGFLTMARLPGLRTPATPLARNPRFTLDRFGVLVQCARSGEAAARTALTLAGALEVKTDA